MSDGVEVGDVDNDRDFNEFSNSVDGPALWDLLSDEQKEAQTEYDRQWDEEVHQ